VIKRRISTTERKKKCLGIREREREREREGGKERENPNRHKSLERVILKYRY
jgi:hypothetical protein